MSRKITKQQLLKIIKEELDNILNEIPFSGNAAYDLPMAHRQHGYYADDAGREKEAETHRKVAKDLDKAQGELAALFPLGRGVQVGSKGASKLLRILKKGKKPKGAPIKRRRTTVLNKPDTKGLNKSARRPRSNSSDSVDQFGSTAGSGTRGDFFNSTLGGSKAGPAVKGAPKTQPALPKDAPKDRTIIPSPKTIDARPTISSPPPIPK
jgi:hypothetical protein